MHRTWVGLAMAVVVLSSGFTCEPSGNPNLDSLEVVVDGIDRLTFSTASSKYTLWLTETTSAITIRATASDGNARLRWNIDREGGYLGFGSGEVTTAFSAGASLFVFVTAPGGATRSYQVDLNPPCADGTECSNGGGPPGICVDDFCVDCAPGASETCDGEDNDCDGEIDEDGVCPVRPTTCVGPSFFHRNLDGVDLSDRTDLDCADFTGSSLRGAVLSKVDLSFADFTGADLTDADLSGANARNAVFTDADMSFADLFGADLDNANFNGADTTGAQ